MKIGQIWSRKMKNYPPELKGQTIGLKVISVRSMKDGRVEAMLVGIKHPLLWVTIHADDHDALADHFPMTLIEDAP